MKVEAGAVGVCGDEVPASIVLFELAEPLPNRCAATLVDVQEGHVDIGGAGAARCCLLKRVRQGRTPCASFLGLRQIQHPATTLEHTAAQSGAARAPELRG